MKAKQIKVEVLIVGGGIMGLALARRYGVMNSTARDNYQVLCLRLSDEDRPRAETLRNQGWLQSGGRYFWRAEEARRRAEERLDALGADEAERQEVEEELAASSQSCDEAIGMHYAASKIRDYFGMRQVRGAMSVPTEEEKQRTAPAIVRRASTETLTEKEKQGTVYESEEGRLSIEEFRRRTLSSSEAFGYLGEAFYREGSLYIQTGEQSFEEDLLLEELRAQCSGEPNVEFRVLQSPAKLEWIEGSPGLARARVLGSGGLCYEIEAGRIFVAAGVGVMQVYRDLKIEQPFTVRRTPLLVTQLPDDFLAAVYEQSQSSFREKNREHPLQAEPSISLVGHRWCGANGEECCVGIWGVGPPNTKSSTDSGALYPRTFAKMFGEDFDVKDHQEKSRRHIESTTVGQMLRALDGFGAGLVERDSLRVTGGFELMYKDGRRDWYPFLQPIHKGSNVVVAHPGRATNALALANRAFRWDKEKDGWEGAPPAQLPTPDPEEEFEELPGEPWEAPICMHYRDEYNFSDVK